MLTRAEPELAPGDFVVLAIGDFNENKNHRVFMEAMAQLSGNVWLFIVGDGLLHGELEALAKWLGASGRVCLFGFCGDVVALLNACDLFCLPLRREGLPVSLIGAMATGTPVLASDAHGYADVRVVRNRDAGAWVDRIAAIAEGGVPATPSELRAETAVFGVVVLAHIYEETPTGREAA